MPNYVCAYTGGEPPASEEEGKKVMESWFAWFASVGADLVDGGTPFGTERKSIASDGTISDGAAAGLNGYSILRANDFDGALAHAKTCPHLAANGAIQVYETHQIPM